MGLFEFTLIESEDKIMKTWKIWIAIFLSPILFLCYILSIITSLIAYAITGNNRYVGNSYVSSKIEVLLFAIGLIVVIYGFIWSIFR